MPWIWQLFAIFFVKHLATLPARSTSAANPCCITVFSILEYSSFTPSSFWQNTQHRKQHAVFLSKKRKYQWWAWNDCSYYITCTSVADPENQIKIRHRNLESQQNDNISKSVGETSLKQEKIQKRSKSTKSYIHFHNFSESSEKNFNVVSHLKVSQISNIKSKKGTGTWNPSRMTTFQGQSRNVTQTRKTSKVIKINQMLYSFS